MSIMHQPVNAQKPMHYLNYALSDTVRSVSGPRGMKGIQGGIPREGGWICMSAYYPLEHLTNTSGMIGMLKGMIYRRKASERTGNQVDPKTRDLAMGYMGIYTNTNM